MTADATPAPWSIPVPLRRSRFVGFAAAHADYNVECDLGAIAAFDLARADDAALVGWADLQAGGSLRRRLGSGRACTFAGKYLKGVGRTQLAGNWRDVDDAYHHSGHLLPSGAVREYVVSRYLAQQGLAHAIVPCEAVLVAPLPAALRDFHARAFGELVARGATPLPVDTTLQALSVKPGGFARFSNFTWLADECVAARTVQPLLAALAHSLGVSAEEADPETLAAALAAAIARGMEHFAAFVRAGVFWGSFHNNFTIDGRFVDLELPTIVGAPFFGHHVEVWPDGERSHPLPVVPGCELLLYLDEAGRFLTHLHHSLRCFIELDRAAESTAREFAAEFARALAEAVPPGHPARDDGAARRATLELLWATFAPDARARALMSATVAGCQERLRGRCRAPFVLDDDWRELPLDPAPRETVLRQRLYWPRLLDLPPLDHGRAIAAQLAELDATVDRDALLAKLAALP